MAAGALILAKHFYVYSTWHRIYALFFITQKRQNVLLHRDEFEATQQFLFQGRLAVMVFILHILSTL